VKWLAVVMAAAVAAAPAAQAAPARKKHRVTPSHRLAKKAPRHKGVTFQRPRTVPLPSASPVPQAGLPQPTATPAPTATPPPPTETRTGIDLDDRNDQLVMRLTYKVLKAGTIELVPFNLGEDDHNLTVKDPAGNVIEDVDMPSGGDAESVVLDNLAAGDYYLFCNVDTHDKLGMHATLTLR
jgi:Sulfocyanin (SoxE) domain